MPAGLTIDAVQLFVLLVAAATAAAFVVRRIGVPYTVVLVLVGLAVALVVPAFELAVPPELILAVFLPGLVFEGAYRLDVTELRRTFGPVLILAVPGVVITAGVVAVVLNLATGLPVELGFLVGAMLSATDPAAILATIRRLRAPDRLTTLIEAESLFNDGTAIVLFVLALRALSEPLSPVDAALSLAIVVLVSTGIGAVGGYLAARLMATVDDHLLELSVTLVLAYGTYLLADGLHQSGVIATVVAAIVLGYFARAGGASEQTQEAIDTVWEFAAYLLTAVLFLLIGLAISLPSLAQAAIPIAWGIFAILAARAVVVYAIVGGASRLARAPRLSTRIPIGWLHVMFAAGMRGAVSVALALSLPPSIPQRDLLVDITFGIVLFTLIVQGLALEPIVGRSLRSRVP